MDVSTRTRDSLERCLELQRAENEKLRRQLNDSWNYAQDLEAELLAIVRVSALHGDAAPVIHDLQQQLAEMRESARRAHQAAAQAKLDLEKYRRDVAAFCKTFTVGRSS